jgi:hypothetical protein
MNGHPAKSKAHSSGRELLAFSLASRLCGKKTTAARKFLAAPILPFMARITPTPVAIPLNP